MARGRRVNSSGEKSKALLLEKAIEQFSANGYHQTKISDIVKAANLTQPTFYLYFHSKESLFKDLNVEFKKQLFDIFGNHVKSVNSQDVREVIYSSLKEIFTYFSKNPNLTKIGFFESNEAEEVKSELSKQFIKILQSDFDVTSSKDIDKSILAESLLGSIERLTLTNLLNNSNTPETLAKQITNIYFEEQKVLV